MTAVLFLGGWLAPFGIAPFTWVPGVDLVRRSRSRSLLFVFFWVRATLPRFRYDQLMRLGWKVFLPVVAGLGGADRRPCWHVRRLALPKRSGRPHHGHLSTAPRARFLL